MFPIVLAMAVGSLFAIALTPIAYADSGKADGDESRTNVPQSVPPPPEDVEIPIGLTASDSKRIEIFKSHWDSQQQGIFSIRIKHCLFRNSGVFRSLSPDEVAKLFQPSDLVDDPGKLRKVIVDGLLKSPLKADPPWSEVEFVADGEKTREDLPGRTNIFDGEDEISHNTANRQVIIGASEGAKQQLAELSTFRFVPDETWSSVNAIHNHEDGVRLFSIPNDKSRIKSWMAIDPSTQMVNRFELASSKRHYCKQVLQGGWVTCDGGVEWPRVHGEFIYSGDPLLLHQAEIMLVNSIEVNGIIAPDTFVVGAQADETVIDYRAEERNDISLNASVSDVKDIGRHLGSTAGDEDSRKRWWVVTGNVLAIVFVMIGVALRRKYRRKTSST